MTLVQLQYVLAVAEYKNFTLAADKSFVTQPTLSMQIQKLEKELNVEIFDRSAHPIKLTQIGERIVEQAKIILREANKMSHLVFEEKGQLEGDFQIGVIPTILPDLVPLFYKTFQTNFPKTNLIFKELQTSEIIEDLKTGRLDFGIAVTPIEDEQIITKPLYNEPFVTYVPQNHPLHSKKQISLSDLNIDDILLLKEGNCFRDNVMNLCERKKSNISTINLESGNIKTLVMLSNEGFGYTILPKLHAEEIPDEYKKNIIPFVEPAPARQVSLIYHQSNLRHTFEENFIKTIQNVVRGKIFMDKHSENNNPSLQVPN